MVKFESAQLQPLRRVRLTGVPRPRARFALATCVPGAAILRWISYSALFLAACAYSIPAVALPLFTGSVLLFVVASWPAYVDVGSDGLTVVGFGQPTQFIAYEHIVSLGRFQERGGRERGIAVHMRDGSRRCLVTKPGFTSVRITDERTERCLQRIAEAHSQWRRSDTALNDMLDGTDQEPRSWVQTLRRSSRGGHPHRTKLVEPEELWAVLEDPAAPPSTRGGAAIALGARGDATSQARIRAAAQATAAEDVRNALTLAADAEAGDEALAAVVAPLLEAENRPAPYLEPNRPHETMAHKWRRLMVHADGHCSR